jgi:hypothetical protein
MLSSMNDSHAKSAIETSPVISIIVHHTVHITSKKIQVISNPMRLTPCNSSALAGYALRSRVIVVTPREGDIHNPLRANRALRSFRI